MSAMAWGSLPKEALFWERTAFLFGAPFFFAVIFGYYRINLPPDYPLLAAIFVRWVGLQITWIGFDLCSQALRRAFRPASRAGVWLTLAVGGVVGAVVMQPVRGLFMSVWVSHFLPATLGTPFPAFESVFDFVRYHVGFTAVPVALWLATHAYFWAAMNAIQPVRDLSAPPASGLPFLPQSPAPPSALKPVGMTQAAYGWPEFIRPTLTKIGADIIAFHSEDHYVRVISTRGSDLVRYRFKDAVRELRPLGFCQIHRTSAVNLAAIIDCNTSVHAAYVSLKRGEQLPVSRSFRIPLIEALQSLQVDPIPQAAE